MGRFTRQFLTERVSLKLQSLGIAGRLAIACVAVLVLVIVTTHLARQSSRRAAEQVAMIESLHEPLARIAQQMSEANASFNQVVLELSNPAAANDAARVNDGLNRMGELAASYQALSPQAYELIQEYLGHVGTHELRARELLLLAERRRALIRQYWKSFDALDREVQAAEERTSATSASTLARALGRVQDRFGAYASAGGPDTARAVAQGEVEFRSALQAHAEELTAIMGAPWLTKLQGQFESIIRSRRSLVSLNTLIGAAGTRFRDTNTELTTFVDTRLGEPTRRALAAAAIDTNDAAANVDETLSRLGIATLIVLLLICAATAYGVIIPVRQLIAAIRGIARGKRGARVSLQGGIQELDALANEFNEMATQLEHAEGLVKHYQARLEERVDERTRQLQFLAHHDPLTKLPNRRQLSEHLESSLARAATAGRSVGVLFLDLDNFKTINDTLGHDVGDALLRAVAERLTQVTQGRAFLARLGGDEFTVVDEQVESVAQVAAFAAAMVERFQRAVDVDGKRLTVGVSVGAAVFPDHGRDATSLLRAADAALFRAKEAGRNRCSVYGPELLEAASTRFQIEQDLRRAIQRGELELFYQPVMSVDSLKLAGVEALLRWRRDDGTIVLPNQFLGVAERSGLIKDISEWVLETAVRQAALWSASGWPNVMMAINVSAQQLLDATFHVRLEATLEKYSLPPQCLEIELTETALQTGAATIDALHWLRSLGVAIALDDFGTGYSSLTSLAELPLTRVKIDRSLMKDIDDSSRSASIVRSIIGLCRSIGLAVTAEGIERRAQLAFLKTQAGVDLQGFLISKPAAISDIALFVKECETRLRELAATLPPIQADSSTSDSMIVRQLRAIGDR